MSKKLITVFGATGNQGGSVIDAVLSSDVLSKKYALRGVTRDPAKSSGQALASKGVEVVKGDLNDAASLEKAVAGSYAVFGVTNYWEIFSGEAEQKQGRAIADAAFAAGVKHLVWSSLPNASKLTEGKLAHIDHFDGKALVEEYIEAHKHASGTAATYFMPAVFMSQLGGLINPTPDGGRAISLHIPGDALLPLIDTRADTGKYVVGAIEAGPEAADGKRIQAVSDWSTPDTIVETINQIAGTSIKFNRIPRDVFKSFLPEQMAEELAENFDLIADYSYYGKGTEKNQAESDRFLLQGTKKTSWKEFAEQEKPWEKK